MGLVTLWTGKAHLPPSHQQKLQQEGGGPTVHERVLTKPEPAFYLAELWERDFLTLSCPVCTEFS